MNRKEIKKKARGILKENVWKILGAAILVSVVAGVITSIVEGVAELFGAVLTTTEEVTLFGTTVTQSTRTLLGTVFDVLSSIVGSVVGFGLVNFTLKVIRGEKAEINDLFNIFSKKAGVIILVSLLYYAITTVCTIFLIIPGIIAALGLSFFAYVTIDDKEGLGAVDLIKKTWNMMNGYKLDYLIFQLSFILWYLACIVIIPIYYVVPYVIVAAALYYEELKNKQEK